MAIDLVTKFQPYTDELFKNESKRNLLTNQDFSWIGAHSIKIYKISTVKLGDYDCAGTGESWSRYGNVAGLDAVTEEFTLTRDRAFTFCIDALDQDETAQQLAAASALARELRKQVVPEIDSYTYSTMVTNAGHKPDALALTASNIYGEILKASESLDDGEIPETNRVLLVPPSVYALMKQSSDITLDSDIGQEQRLRSVIGMLDGASVVKVPAVRLPKNFGFMLCHPSATVCPLKLEAYNIHQNPPGISGALIEGRIAYGCFCLDNKKSGIYYQAQPVTPPSSEDGGKG